MARIIGIHPRAKKESSTDDEEGKKQGRGTSVAIKDLETQEVVEFTLTSDADERDFLLGRFVTSWRKMEEGEDLTLFFPRHIKEVKRKGEVISIRVPDAYEGLMEGDTALMQMGGSGDRFAYALSRRGQEIGSTLSRIPPYRCALFREENNSSKDHLLLIDIFESIPKFFYEVGLRERRYIRVSASFRTYLLTQRDRISCQLRIYDQHREEVSLSEEGYYPEGNIEEEYDKILRDDPGYAALLKREKEAEKKMRQAVRELEVWDVILKKIPGMGERIAAGIIGPTRDVLRFIEEPDLTGADTQAEIRKRRRKAKERSMNNFVKFCGLHVNDKGGLPRRRRNAGEDEQYGNNPRQSFYLLGDQFVRRPDSYGGQRLREIKVRLRQKHPEIVVVDGKKRYTDGHIHKMAIWRVLTLFCRKFFRHWVTLEKFRVKETIVEKEVRGRAA